MRYFNLAVLLAVIAVIAMAGVRGHHFGKPPFEIFPDMNYQPKVKDQQGSAFFADGVASRPPIDGTIAEEMPATLDYWSTGKFDAGHWGDGIPAHPGRYGYHDHLQRELDSADERPLAVTDSDMARGRERYSINCAVCHGAAGDGKGITSNYGINATSYQSDRIRTMNDGEIFNTITNGKGQMMGYGYNIEIDDRWRIVMYIRALQHAQNAKLQDASAEEQNQLNNAKKPSTTDNFQIKYLDKRTMVGWMDSYDLGGVMSNAHQNSCAVPVNLINDQPAIIGPTFYYSFSQPPKVSLQRMGTKPRGIKYLNQQTVHGWSASLEPGNPGMGLGQ